MSIFTTNPVYRCEELEEDRVSVYDTIIEEDEYETVKEETPVSVHIDVVSDETEERNRPPPPKPRTETKPQNRDYDYTNLEDRQPEHTYLRLLSSGSGGSQGGNQHTAIAEDQVFKDNEAQHQDRKTPERDQEQDTKLQEQDQNNAIQDQNIKTPDPDEEQDTKRQDEDQDNNCPVTATELSDERQA